MKQICKFILLTGKIFLFIGLISCKNTKFERKEAFFNQTQASADPVFTKFNLESLVVGKNSLEIEQILGRSNGKTLIPNGEYLLDYRKSVLDEDTGKIFDWSLITFRFHQGICTSVEIILADKPEQLFAEEDKI
jgi:hypothetical protein